jgi:hypothetical protein
LSCQAEPDAGDGKGSAMNHRPPQTRQERAETLPRHIVAGRGVKRLLGAFTRFYGHASAGDAWPSIAGDKGRSQKQGVRTGYEKANPAPSVHYRKVHTRPCTPAPVQVFTCTLSPTGRVGTGCTLCPGCTLRVYTCTLWVSVHLTKAGSTY